MSSPLQRSGEHRFTTASGIRETSTTSHNLVIENYSLDELLGLFDLKSYQLTINDIKKAKHRVLMLHPDKSRLPAEYFLFYKKAFDVVFQFYENQNRQSQQITENTTKYRPMEENKGVNRQVNKVIEKMSSGDFNDKFNQLFETNQMGDRPDPKRNEWFQSDKSAYNVPETVSASGMNDAFDSIKKQSNGLIRYKGVQEIDYSGSSASNLYGEDGDDSYISSNPFSKLKFDDLRKVHKDQTVFDVSEKDFSKMQTFSSVEQYNRARSQFSYDPLEKTQAEQILVNKEKALQEQIMRKEYEAKIRSQQYEQKNKTVLSSFLHLGN
jgi:hypothetical protein